MTGPTGDGHVGLDRLADLGEGLLTPGEVADVEAHLVGCAACAAARAELLAVPALLAAAASAEPMPADVVSRVDEALRASRDEVGAATGHEPVGSGASATVTPIPVRDRTPTGMRLLQAAALLVVVFAGLGLAFTAFQGGGDESATSAGGAADSTAERSAGGGFPVSASGRNWSPETVTSGVPDIVAGSLGAVAAQEDSGGETPAAPRTLATEETARLAGGPPLAECVTALNDGPVTPLGVDLASWQGNPAVVIVLPTPGDPSTVDAWVVGPECSQADATVLYFARVARP